jgi:hypothetical protein
MKKTILFLFLIMLGLSFTSFGATLAETQKYLTDVGYESMVQGEFLVITPNHCFQKYAFDIIDFLKWFMSLMAVFILINVVYKYFAGVSKELNLLKPITTIAVCLIMTMFITPLTEFATNTKISSTCESLKINLSDLGKDKDINELIRFYSME